jgi:glycosyltransferase involved in cell wall biosynthesis
VSLPERNLIVIPAYNEEDSLPVTVASLQSLPDGFELLVVNDGSTDATSRVAHALAASSRLPLRVVDLPLNGGIGVAVQTGYLFAAQARRFRYVIQFDADGQHEASAILALVQACDRDNLDLCIGSRFLNARSDVFRSTFLRRAGIRFLAWLIRFLGKTRVTDPTSGFRCAGPRAWQDFAERYPDDYPEPESLYWCIRNRLRVGEIPVVMFERRAGRSSIRAWRSLYYMLKVTLAIAVDLLRPKEACRP